MPAKRKKPIEIDAVQPQTRALVAAQKQRTARDAQQAARKRRLDTFAEMMAKEDARLVAQASARALRRGLH